MPGYTFILGTCVTTRAILNCVVPFALDRARWDFHIILPMTDFILYLPNEGDVIAFGSYQGQSTELHLTLANKPDFLESHWVLCHVRVSMRKERIQKT